MTQEQDASDLSREAYESLPDETRETIQRKVLFVLAKRGQFGATDEELIRELAPIKQNSIAPARHALSRMDPPLVIKKRNDNGNRVFRMSTSNRRCQVWVVSDPKHRLKIKRVSNKVKGGYALFEIDERGQYIFKKHVYSTVSSSAQTQADAWVHSTPKGES